jgi:hypothetical protein
MMRWTFGEQPLAQTEALAGSLRRLTGLALSLEAEEGAVDELLAVLQGAEARLAALAPPEPLPRVGADVASDGRVYLDHSRDIGAFNPCFPEYSITVDGDRATGRVSFPVAYEGPPGLVHGGFLAVFFDSVIQHHNCDVGVAGKTTSLALRYRRPTPLLTDLDFEVTRVVDGERITSSGRLLAGDVVLCEAEMRAVAGDRARLPQVSPRRAPR